MLTMIIHMQSFSNHHNNASTIMPTDQETVTTSACNTWLQDTGGVHTKPKEKDKANDDQQSYGSTSYHTTQPSTHEIATFILYCNQE